MKGPTEGLLGCHGVVAQPRQPPQHQVHLDLAAVREIGYPLTQQAGQHGRCHVGQDDTAPHDFLLVSAAVAHLAVG